MNDARSARGPVKPRIGITGSYGGLNLGDEAILQSIIDQLRDEAELVIFSRDAEDSERRHHTPSIPVRQITREQSREVVGQLDVLVLGGGGLLFDAEAEYLLRELRLAHEIGVPVVVYGISAGPLTGPHVRELVREVLNGCAAITVRDRHGLQLLQDIGVDKPLEVTADPALLLRPAKMPRGALRREGLGEPGRRVGLCVRELGPAAPDLDAGHYLGLVANAADFVIERFDADVVFVPMERRSVDVQQCHAVAARMQHADRASVLRGDYGPAQLLMLMRRFEFVIGMRLHFLILAALAGVPFVSLPYASKVTGFIEELKLPAPPLKDLSAGTLLAHIDRSWDLRRQLRERIAERLPAMRGRARRNHEILMQIVREEVRRRCPH